jgi:capsular polysaccharide biosynthesis protein
VPSEKKAYMNLPDVLRALIARWYLLIVGLAATAVLSVMAFQQVPPTYEARGTVLLLPPEAVLSEGANPFLYLGGLEQPAEIVAKYLDADAPREALAEAEPTASYSVTLDQSATSGPIIAVTVEDVTPEGSIRALNTVLDSVPTALQALERSISVPEGSSIRSMRLSVDEEPVVVNKETTRAVLAAAAVGLLATVLGIAVLDGLLRRIAERRSASREAASVETPSLSPEAVPEMAAAPFVDGGSDDDGPAGPGRTATRRNRRNAPVA